MTAPNGQEPETAVNDRQEPGETFQVSPDDIAGLVCPACRTDVVLQPGRGSSHTLIWHCGELGEQCEAGIRSAFRFPSLQILASRHLYLEKPEANT